MSSAEVLRILLIEDSPTDALLIRATLEDGMATPFTLNRVDKLSAGLERLRHHDVDLLLVDLTLPDSSGLETFLKVHEQAPHVPIVVLTGIADHELALSAVRQGAQDYLVKNAIADGFLPHVVRFAVERSRRLRVEGELHEAEAESQAARKIQEHLLPKHPPDVPGFDIVGGCQPAAATGGDLFDFISMPNGEWGIVVADVSSHGFAPALIMAGTRRLLRTIAQQHDDLGELATVANRAVCEDTSEGQFVTLLFARLNPHTREFQYAGAGHEGFLLDPSGTVQHLDSTGMVLGVIEGTEIASSETLTLNPDDLVVVVTDGFQEARSPEHGMFGIDAVLDVIHSNRHKPAEEIVSVLFEATREFCRPESPLDDMTVVLIKVQ